MAKNHAGHHWCGTEECDHPYVPADTGINMCAAFTQKCTHEAQVLSSDDSATECTDKKGEPSQKFPASSRPEPPADIGTHSGNVAGPYVVHSTFGRSYGAAYWGRHNFTVRGQWYNGVLVDPGASHSLIGMRTLDHMRKRVLWPAGRTSYPIDGNGPKKRLSGIDGVVTYAAGKCEIPIGIGPLELDWQPDIIRSDGGDDCPGLFGQEMLQYLNVSIHWSYFDTGDALMVLPQEDQNMAWGIRLLATATSC